MTIIWTRLFSLRVMSRGLVRWDFFYVAVNLHFLMTLGSSFWRNDFNKMSGNFCLQRAGKYLLSTDKIVQSSTASLILCLNSQIKNRYNSFIIQI